MLIRPSRRASSRRNGPILCSDLRSHRSQLGMLFNSSGQGDEGRALCRRVILGVQSAVLVEAGVGDVEPGRNDPRAEESGQDVA